MPATDNFQAFFPLPSRSAALPDVPVRIFDSAPAEEMAGWRRSTARGTIGIAFFFTGADARDASVNDIFTVRCSPPELLHRAEQPQQASAITTQPKHPGQVSPRYVYLHGKSCHVSHATPSAAAFTPVLIMDADPDEERGGGRQAHGQNKDGRSEVETVDAV